MIGYVTLGTNDLEKASAFYDQLLAGMGASRMFTTDQLVGWSAGQGKAMLTVTQPFDKQSATVGNGVMVALSVDDAEKVDTMYQLALSLGATDEGAPGLRGQGFYGGYFRDLDGNKLNFYCYL
jgi:predicted lactoylglutathione lyase